MSWKNSVAQVWKKNELHLSKKNLSMASSDTQFWLHNVKHELALRKRENFLYCIFLGNTLKMTDPRIYILSA